MSKVRRRIAILAAAASMAIAGVMLSRCSADDSAPTAADPVRPRLSGDPASGAAAAAPQRRLASVVPATPPQRDRARQRLKQLQLCAHRESDQQLLDSPEQIAAGAADARVMGALARLREQARARLAEAQTACAGIGVEQLADRYKLLQELEAMGDPEASLCYALEGMAAEYLPRRYSDEWLAAMQRYRARSDAAIERAYAAGMPGAALLQYERVSPPGTRLGALENYAPSPDPARAYALALLMARLDEDGTLSPLLGLAGDWRARARMLEPALDAQARGQAQAYAAQQAAHFASPPPLAGLCPQSSQGVW